ncbi:MAG: hypothetical protein ACLRWQ_09815 [Flavonifractor plautii]
MPRKSFSELEEHGYQIRRNGVSNYTLDKKSRVVFHRPRFRIIRTTLRAPRTSPAGSGCAIAF